MKKFLVLYRAPSSAMEQMAKASPEQAKAGMDLWMKWKNANDKSIVDLGMPLGNGSDPKSDIVGYSILQADSMKSVRKVLENHPHLHTKGGSISVLEFLAMPGM